MLKYLYLIFITLFKLFCDFLYVSEIYLDRTLPKYQNYDYIIVGSGSSGSNLKLNGNVLILDAGGYGSSFIFNIPLIQPLLLRSNYDYKHETIPQKNACKALNKQKSFWPSGKIVGGTSRLNNMIYHRSHHNDYRDFVSEFEADSYFKKLEEEVPVSESYFKSMLSHAFIDGAKELGFEDFSYTNLTHKHGRRVTQFNNHWRIVKKPPEITTNSLVTKILFDDNNEKKAIGVEFIKNGNLHKVFGSKIILAAGALGSPKILMHSGIGKREDLEKFGINVIEDLPVGENLQDHVTTFIDVLLNQSVGVSVSDIFNPKNMIKYLWNGKDSSLSFGGSDAMGFVKLNENSKTPDISLILIPTGITFDFGQHLKNIVNLRDDVWKEYYEPLIGQTSVTILPILLHPKSIGNVRLKSKNFNDPLLINPNYLADKDDVDKLIGGIRVIQKILETSNMKKFNAELIPKALPGCEKFEAYSSDYWSCYIQHMTFTMYHPIGTCKLGDYHDKTTVVLKNFQVKNIENLYVVDASVLPHLPSANPHALIAMLAQKFSNDMNTNSNFVAFSDVIEKL